MKPLTIAGYVAAALLISSAAQAETFNVCGMGTVRSVTIGDSAARRARPQWQATPQRSDVHRPPQAVSASQAPGQNYRVWIQLDDMVYSAQAPAAAGSAHPTRLVDSRPMLVCVDENEITYSRSNGPRSRTTILETLRIAN